MGVTRREGDWRLEKVEEGTYEITYKHDVQLEVLTSKHSPRTSDPLLVETTPVREVDSYSEVEGLFEENAHGRPPGSVGPVGGSISGSSRGSSFEDAPDLPPGAIALVLLFAGGFAVSRLGTAGGETMVAAGVLLLAGGVAIFGWAGVLFKREGLGEALDYLVFVEDDTDSDTTSDKPEKTPPAPEKLKNEIIFDRAEQHCEWCEDWSDNLEVHHITPRSKQGPNEPSNLIALCPNCHRKADGGVMSRSKLRAKVRRQSGT